MRSAPAGKAVARLDCPLFLEPDSPEPRALGLLTEALHRLADRAQTEEIAVARDRHLLVEELRGLLPQRVALLGIGLARHLRHQAVDLLVVRPARPVRPEIDVVRRVEEVAHAGREDVVLL